MAKHTKAGSLRHRVTVQRRAAVQDPVTGEMSQAWAAIATVWASIEPLSVREFIQSGKDNARIDTRITIRHREDVLQEAGELRIVHEREAPMQALVYMAHGVLADADSGLEYLTIPCSSGARQ